MGARFQLATTLVSQYPQNQGHKHVLFRTCVLCNRPSHRWFYECCRAGYSLPSKRPRWPPVEVAEALTTPLSLIRTTSSGEMRRTEMAAESDPLHPLRATGVTIITPVGRTPATPGRSDRCCCRCMSHLRSHCGRSLR